MPAAITVRHNLETAHRLPDLGGKCTNLHGHSWWVAVTVSAPAPGPGGVLVDFALLKRHLRGWVDQHLDHGAMLGAADTLCAPLMADRCKLYRFDAPDPSEAEQHALGLTWPTVENVAALLARVAAGCLSGVSVDATVSRVVVTETATNSAEWTP